MNTDFRGRVANTPLRLKHGLLPHGPGVAWPCNHPRPRGRKEGITMRVGIAVLATLALANAGCAESGVSDPLDGGGILTEAELVVEEDVTSSLAMTKLGDMECHFGKPLEMDEYNGLVYVSGGRPSSFIPSQIVDMWIRQTPEVFELPDDISWTCNPAELENSAQVELVAHDYFPDDIRNFRLVQLYDNPANFIPKWYLSYDVPVPVRGVFVKRMVLKLWDYARFNPLLDSVPVTVTACDHPGMKNQCINDL